MVRDLYLRFFMILWLWHWYVVTIYIIHLFLFFLIFGDFPDFLRHGLSIICTEVVQNSWKRKKRGSLPRKKSAKQRQGSFPVRGCLPRGDEGNGRSKKNSPSGLQSLALFPRTAKVALRCRQNQGSRHRHIICFIYWCNLTLVLER